MIVVAIAMVAIIAMAALSIDVVTLYLARMETQRSADAAALAAARVISISGLTGDPTNSPGSWVSICGGAGTPATEAAVTAAKQNLIGGVAPTTADIAVKYSAGGTSSANCSGLPAGFGVNPLVTVVVTRTGLPTFFSRLWGNTGNKVSATASAEAFNSSNSGNVGNGRTGTITPVWPRCVKPWMVPNLDPLNPSGSGCTTNCTPFVATDTGQIQHQGYSLNGTGTTGVIGERFTLIPDCQPGSPCTVAVNPPEANSQAPSLQYLPGQPPLVTPVAVPSCSAQTNMYQEAIAGCDQSTVYQCGAPLGNTINLAENPGAGDTTNGVACLIDEDNVNAAPPSGQDTINLTSYPFRMEAGSSNPLVGYGLATGAPITASNSIVSVPIYDSSSGGTQIKIGTGLTQVTIVGFLQVFINSVDKNGDVDVTVLNVTGCSNGGGKDPVGPAVTGSSPVPIRLITPP